MYNRRVETSSHYTIMLRILCVMYYSCSCSRPRFDVFSIKKTTIDSDNAVYGIIMNNNYHCRKIQHTDYNTS